MVRYATKQLPLLLYLPALATLLMTNFEILRLLHNTRLRLNDLNKFTAQVRALLPYRDELLTLYGDIAAFDGKQANYIARVNQELGRVVAELQSFSSREFYASTFELTTILKDLTATVTIAHPIAGKVLHELDALQDSFDSFTQNHAANRALKVAFQAHSFIEALDSYIEYTEFIASMLRSDQEAPKQAGTLDIYMPAELTFEEFIVRLDSINEIYQELAQIVGVSTSDEPLRILKVESGSLWASVFGNWRIMALMDDLLRGAARYMHRNFTHEGKIEALPTSLKSMDEILNFTNRLKESGVDVKDIQDQLAKGTVLIAKEMNALLANQSSVTINGEDIQLSESRRQDQLEGRRVPRLQDGSQEA